MLVKHLRWLSANMFERITLMAVASRRRATSLLATAALTVALVSTSMLLLPASAAADSAAPVVAGSLSATDRAGIETEVMRVLDNFMTTFNARDPAAHAATYQFPHFRLARGNMNSWPTAEDAIGAHKLVFAQLPNTGWARSQWLSRDTISISDSKVHVNTHFQRLRADGSIIGTYNSLYILIKQEGRWGIKMRSSFL
jgi:hypothetical protein